MWQYNNMDELYHFGILGMRWGNRKSKLLENKINKLEKKRESIYNKKGVANNKFIQTSKNLYSLEKKLEYQKAKNSGNSTDIILKKDKYNNSKYTKKPGSTSLEVLGYNKSELKNIYGKNRTDKEIKAIRTKEFNNTYKKENAKYIVNKSLGAIGTAALLAPVVIPLIKSGKHYLINGVKSSLRYNWVDQAFTYKYRK